MTSQFVVDANEQSIRTRKRDGKDLTSLITHHDNGSQYLSVAYTEHLDAAGIKPSTGTVGSFYDNTLAESINGHYRPSSSSPASPGRASRTSRSQPPNGSTGLTTTDRSGTAKPSHPPKPKRSTTFTTRAQQPLETQARAPPDMLWSECGKGQPAGGCPFP